MCLKSKVDSIIVYKAEDIVGYKVGKEYFRKHESEGRSYFIHQIKSGKISLYERPGLFDDQSYIYLLDLKSTNTYFVIDPDEAMFTEYVLSEKNNSNNSPTARSFYFSNGVDEKFKLFIAKNLSDCNLVKNMVNSGYYTIKNIPSIVETYNKCFD